MAIAIIGIAGIVEIVRLEEDVNLFYTFMIKGYVYNLCINFVMILGQSEWDITATPIHLASSAGHAITCNFTYGVSADSRDEQLLY